jgi:hypothetical protein
MKHDRHARFTATPRLGETDLAFNSTHTHTHTRRRRRRYLSSPEREREKERNLR